MPPRNTLVFTNVILLVVAFPSPSAQADSADEQLGRLFDDAWEFRLREDPLFATNAGDRRYDDRLPEISLAASKRREEMQRKFVERLQRIDRAALSKANRVNYDVFKKVAADRLAEFRFQSYLTPITSRSGFHVDFPDLAKQLRFDNVKDYENYIARLGGFRAYAGGYIELMREGVKKGLVLPAVVLRGYDQSLAPHIVDDPAKSLLFEPLTKFPASIGEKDQQRLAQAAKKAIADSVVPGYRGFLEFMKKEYVPGARDQVGARALPDGDAFYRHRVKRFTTLDLTPQEVHAIGKKEVARILKEMDGVIRRAKFDGDRRAFVKFLRNSERFYAKTPEELMKETAAVMKRMDGQLPRLFKTLPRMPYGLRRIPDYIAPHTTTAYYSGPAGDGTRAGFYYVNTFNLKTRPLYEVQALSLHEAVPGHHLQIALQQELTDLPKFRRFSDITAYIEGWALYAERLGLEVGFYEDPYSDFGRLSYEMWRACRLVVDTGMHYLGWTRQQAIDYMAENTALSLHNITTEVDRYICWPGQALAYKMGELKIRQLRKLAEQELGEKFDVREFHDVVLKSGAVPLEVLEANVMEYIKGMN